MSEDFSNAFLACARTVDAVIEAIEKGELDMGIGVLQLLSDMFRKSAQEVMQAHDRVPPP